MFEFLEDPRYPSLSPHLRWLEWTGIWCPNPKSYSARFKIFFFYVTVIFFFTQYVKLIMDLKLESLQLVLQYAPFHFGILKGCFFKYNYKKWSSLIDYVLRVERGQVEGDRKTDHVIVKGYVRKNRLLLYSYWVFGVFSICFILYQTFESIRAGEIQGSIFLNIFDGFASLSLDSPGSTILIAVHLILGLNAGMFVVGFDSLFITIMMFFANQLKIAKQYAKEVVNPNDSEETHRNIQKVHKFYFDLIEYHNKLDLIIFPIMVIYLMVIIINLGVCIINIVDAQNDFGKLLSSLLYLQGCLTQLVLFYWFANEITEESMRVSYGCYDSEWYYCNQSLKKEIHLLGTSMNKRLVLRTGPIQEMTLTTFVSILRGSYSIYTLLVSTQ